MKLITLNIWKGGSIQNKAINFLKKEGPDIITLQEVYNRKEPYLEDRYRSLEILKIELPLKYFDFAPAFRDITKKDNLDAEQGNAIFSRFLIKKSNIVFFGAPYQSVYDYEEKKVYDVLPRILQNVAIEIESTTFHIYNIHGIWGLDGNDNEKRLKMSETIVDEIKNKKNIILAGDFNVRPDTKTIKNIEKYLKNVFKDELTTTFNVKRKSEPGGYATSVVDMIFVSPDMKVVDHYCPDEDISDHLPLVCVFEI